MTIREINRTISTANYAKYTISELGGGNIVLLGDTMAGKFSSLKDLYATFIPKSYKGAQVAAL